MGHLLPKTPYLEWLHPGVMMLRAWGALCAQAGRSASGWQALSFDGGVFRLKGTGELVRALLVLRLCSWPPLITHGLAVSRSVGGGYHVVPTAWL